MILIVKTIEFIILALKNIFFLAIENYAPLNIFNLLLDQTNRIYYEKHMIFYKITIIIKE